MAKKTGDKFNKSKAVRESLEKLGMDATVDAVMADVKATHGADLGKATVSQYRSLARKKAGVSRRSRKPGRPRKIALTAAVPAKTKNDSGDILGFLEEIKAWEAKIGEKAIKKVVDALYS